MQNSMLIAKTASAAIGADYQHGAAGPHAFDDFGVAQYAAAAAGITLSRPQTNPYHVRRPAPEYLLDSLDQSELSKIKIETSDDIQPGDILAFRLVAIRPADCVGVVIGRDEKGTPRFAYGYPGRGVTDQWFCRFWIERLVGVYRARS